ncbi:MAG: hypothetical protein MUP63_00890 [Candidatus Nanohaloarchaeota archaeon QJJ-7]|nr:hypothetical protein [Candidatus Nanohaloarchaeota archaeon QJJ-7]
MEERVQKILENEMEKIQEAEIEEPELIEMMMEVEKQNREREELLEWLSEKKRRQEIINDEERVESLLSHLEEAYRTASISENSYHEAKKTNKELLS